MRVTFQSQYREAAAGIETAAERMAEYQRQVSTGLKVGKPSDDPSASAALVSERAQLARMEQYTRAGDTVTSRLTVIDTVLSDIISKLTAAQSATMAARGSEKTTVERETAAQSLLGIKAALLDDLNTSFHGTYLFSGSATTTKPYTVDGAGVVQPYAGSTDEASIDIGNNRSVVVAYNGSEIVQGSDPVDVFTELDALVDAVRNGDEAGITAGMGALQRAFQRASTAQMRVGVGLEAVTSEQARLEAMRLSTQERVSKLQDADIAQAITGMSQADAAFQAALAAIGAASRASLMDYLK